MSKATEQLEAIIRPAVEACSVMLWGIEYLSQGRYSTLKVYIDHNDGVDVDMCAQVSYQVSAILDVEDPISGEYNLEISSPGLDRPLFELSHYRDNLGATADVRLRRAFEGRRKFVGVIAGIEADDVVLCVDDKEFLFPVDAIDKANIVPQF